MAATVGIARPKSRAKTWCRVASSAGNLETPDLQGPRGFWAGNHLSPLGDPWGSGTDNSPRWDAELAAVEVGELPPYPRYDL